MLMACIVYIFLLIILLLGTKSVNLPWNVPVNKINIATAPQDFRFLIFFYMYVFFTYYIYQLINQSILSGIWLHQQVSSSLLAHYHLNGSSHISGVWYQPIPSPVLGYSWCLFSLTSLIPHSLETIRVLFATHELSQNNSFFYLLLVLLHCYSSVYPLIPCYLWLSSLLHSWSHRFF